MAGAHFLPGLSDAGQAYPAMCVKLLPAGLLGLMIAAMFAATMSSLSSDYNVCASVLTVDVYRRFFRANASQQELVFVGRLMTLAVGGVSLSLAFLFAHGGGEDQFRTMVKLFSIATAPVAVPMIAGLLSRHATNVGALAGFLAGITVGLTMFLMCPDPLLIAGSTWKLETVLLWSTTLTTLAVMIVASALHTVVGNSRRAAAEAFMHRLATPIGETPADLPEGIPADEPGYSFSPFRIVGTCVTVIGLMLLLAAPFSGNREAVIINAVVGGLMTAGGLGVMRRTGAEVRGRAIPSDPTPGQEAAGLPLEHSPNPKKANVRR
jgi:hypothetical protein